MCTQGKSGVNASVTFQDTLCNLSVNRVMFRILPVVSAAGIVRARVHFQEHRLVNPTLPMRASHFCEHTTCHTFSKLACTLS